MKNFKENDKVWAVMCNSYTDETPAFIEQCIIKHSYFRYEKQIVCFHQDAREHSAIDVFHNLEDAKQRCNEINNYKLEYAYENVNRLIYAIENIRIREIQTE